MLQICCKSGKILMQGAASRYDRHAGFLYEFLVRLSPAYFSKLSLVDCKIWGVIQQRVYQPQL